MRSKTESSIIVCQTLFALVLALLGSLSAQAQCNTEQTHKLVREDSDMFGQSVGIDGTIAIIGECCAVPFTGTAYLYDVNSGKQLFELQPEDGAIDAAFGNGVAISGKIAIVGAGGNDDNGEDSGSAYLFDTTTGQQINKLLPEDGEENDRFGSHGVAIDGTTAIVGAWRDDDNGDDSGSAYLFDTTSGQQITKLVPDDGAAEDRFGFDVAISGTIAIVGARLDDDNGENSGSAYLFETTTGKQLAKLLPIDGVENDNFGRSVAIDGTIAIVGARWDDDNGDNSGAAYVFDVTTGEQILKLLPDDGSAGDQFGWTVAISGNIALITAIEDDDNGDGSGSAYIFDVATGKQLAKLVSDDGSAGDDFGNSLAITGTTALVGAWLDDIGNNKNKNSGSAYVFEISCDEGDLVNAHEFNIFRGISAGGKLSDTFQSDDSYLKFNPGLTINSAEPPVWIEFEGTLPTDSPASLTVTLEAQAGTTGLTQTIEMFNYNSGGYELVDSQAASFNSDSVVTVDLSDGISDYVQSGTGAIETRVGWDATGLILNYPWTICIDQVVWTVTQ